MKTGRVCEKHNEYSADGVCRWCEPPMTATEICDRQATHDAEMRAAEERANVGIRALLDEKMRELEPLLERLRREYGESPGAQAMREMYKKMLGPAPK